MTETIEQTQADEQAEETQDEAAVEETPRYVVTRLKAVHVKNAAMLIGKLMNDPEVSGALSEFVAQGQREAALTAAWQEEDDSERKAELGNQLSMVRRHSQNVQTQFFSKLVSVGIEKLPDDLDNFLGSLVGMSKEEVEDADADFYPEVIDALVESKGFGSFLASVRKLAARVSGKFNTLSSAITGGDQQNS